MAPTLAPAPIKVPVAGEPLPREWLRFFSDTQQAVSAFQNGGSGVTSVNGQSGAVVLTAESVDADPAGSAAAAQNVAESFATAAVAVETARATAAENTLTTNLNTKITGIGTKRIFTGPTAPANPQPGDWWAQIISR